MDYLIIYKILFFIAEKEKKSVDIVKMVEEREESVASVECTETNRITEMDSLAVLPTGTNLSIQNTGVSCF